MENATAQRIADALERIANALEREPGASAQSGGTGSGPPPGVP